MAGMHSHKASHKASHTAALAAQEPLAGGRAAVEGVAGERPAAAPGPARAFLLAWGVFWLLLITVAVQDHLRQGQTDLWRPLLWELSSCAVASLLVWRAWRHVPRLDGRLAQPWRWLALPLTLLPALAPLFVGAVFAIRHGVYALVGQSYRHAPWPEVLAYESLKFAIFYLLFAAVFFGMRSFAALHAERLRAESSVALAREAQLVQLAQQIEPHFLFNALNTVAAAIPEQPARAERLLLRLASLLRAATNLARRPVVSLAEELALLEAYAEIMGERFADRVTLHWHVDESLHACRVPALILQPLLENAFRHGVERHAGPARIEIELVRVVPIAPASSALLGAHAVAADAAPAWRATVSCNLGSLPPAHGPQLELGVGLTNVRRRLALAHGEAASLRLERMSADAGAEGGSGGGGVRVTVELPCVY